MNEVSTIEDRAFMTVAAMKKHVGIVQAMMSEVMQDKIHYGTIPGCGDKPALLKPGAEKIMMTFRLSPAYEVEDLSTSDTVRYRIKTIIKTRDGIFLGDGLGEASSGEEKYQWRGAVCQEEYDETPIDQKREKWAKKWDKAKNAYVAKKIHQVKTTPADIANTILKMAKKRSLIDATLTVTAASDCFQQDVEDLSPEVRESIYGEEGKPTVNPPKAKEAPAPAPAANAAPAPAAAPQATQEQKPQAEKPAQNPNHQPPPEGSRLISEAQVGRLLAIAKASGHSADDVDQYISWEYNLESKAHIQKGQMYEDIVAHFQIQKGA